MEKAENNRATETTVAKKKENKKYLTKLVITGFVFLMFASIGGLTNYVTFPVMVIASAAVIVLFGMLYKAKTAGWENTVKMEVITSLLGTTLCFFFLEGSVYWCSQIGTVILGITNYLLMFAIYWFIYMLSGRGKFTLIFMSAVSFVLSFVNVEIFIFRGKPFYLRDLASLKTGMSVADSYSLVIPVYYYFFIALLIISVILLYKLIGRAQDKKTKLRTSTRILSIVFIVMFFVLIPANAWCKATDSYFRGFRHGPNGLVYNMMLDVKTESIKKPDGYTKEDAEKIIKESGEKSEDTAENNSESENLPDVVVSMNEAFCSYDDLLEKNGNDTNSEVTPYLNSLEGDNVVKGSLNVSVYGGNTANSEFEFLTGDSCAYYNANCIPYTSVIKDQDIEGIVSHMKSLGYTTVAMHPYMPGGWNRERVYADMGFDETVFLQDYKNCDETLRDYITDKANYQEILDILDEHEEPLFIFNISIQNHGAYGDENNVIYKDRKIKMVKPDHDSEVYLNLINMTDTATKWFIEELSGRDEDTAFLFFGDHKPGALSEKNGLDSLIANTTYKDEENAYTTNYYMWKNYKTENSLQDTESTSINYLSEMLLEYADLPLSDYMEYAKDLRAKYPVISSYKVVDSNGKTYDGSDESVFEKDKLKEYGALVYYHLHDN